MVDFITTSNQAAGVFLGDSISAAIKDKMNRSKRINIDGRYYSQFTYKKTPQAILWSSKGQRENLKRIRKYKKSIRETIKSGRLNTKVKDKNTGRIIPADYRLQKFKSLNSGNQYYIFYKYETAEEVRRNDPFYGEKDTSGNRLWMLSRQEQIEIILREYGDNLDDLTETQLTINEVRTYRRLAKERLEMEIRKK